MELKPYKNPITALQARVATVETTLSALPPPSPPSSGGTASLDPIYEHPATPSPVMVAADGTLSTQQGTRLVNLGKVHTVTRTTGVVPPAYQATITAPLALLAGGNLTLRFAIQPTIAGSISVQLDSGPVMTATGNGTTWTSNDAGLVARSDNGWSWFEVNIPQRNDAGTVIKVTMPIGLVQLPCLYYPPVQTTIDPSSLVGMKLSDSGSGKSVNSIVETLRFSTIAEMQAFKYPRDFSQAIVGNTRYEYRKGAYVLGFPGVIEMPLGRWQPINWTTDPSWIRSTDYATRYERTLKGETINRLQFDVCQRDDRTKTLAMDITDFVTGCSVSGYWGIMGKFSTVTVVDRSLTLFVGVDIPTGRVLLMVQDPNIANPKFCWLRNVRVNGLPADFIDLGDMARSAFPKN